MTRVTRATPQDHDTVAALLRAADLPVDGLDQDHVSLLVARDGRLAVGCAAVESYGPTVLLRSVAVSPAHRGTGVGRQLVAAALGEARRRAATDAVLLTTDASDYFARLGFRLVTRDEVRRLSPAAATSVQFTTACPDDAQAMHRRLDTDQPPAPPAAVGQP